MMDDFYEAWKEEDVDGDDADVGFVDLVDLCFAKAAEILGRRLPLHWDNIAEEHIYRLV